MKKLKYLFFRLCYLWGFYPTRIKKPSEFCAYLESQPSLIKEYELRNLTTFIGVAGDHKYYNYLLKEYVPQWENIILKESKFIGTGYGDSSLNAFRKVRIGRQTLFEKVYFNTQPAVLKVQWFQNNIYGFVKDKIKAPPVKKTFSGTFLTILYFEYLELPRPADIEERTLVQFSKELYQFSFTKTLEELKPGIPGFIKDFKTHHQYKKFGHPGREALMMHGIKSVVFENRAASSFPVLSHGDLQDTNVFEHSTLVDWDSFGLYPSGMEQAFLFFRLLFKKNKAEDPLDWLSRFYKNTVSEELWMDFERNFTYFLFIFSMELFLNNQKKEVEQRLIEKLKSYL